MWGFSLPRYLKFFVYLNMQAFRRKKINKRKFFGFGANFKNPKKQIFFTYSVGWNTKSLTLFLWFVNVQIDLPAAKSHNLIVESCDPVITWGSEAWAMTVETVWV